MRSKGNVLLNDKLWQALVQNGVPVTFKAKSVIYTKDAPTKGLYCIVSGRVKNHVEDENGNEVILTIYSDNEIIGEVAALNGWPQICSATALEETYAVRVSPEKVRELFFRDPQLAYYLVEHTSKKLLQASGQSFALTKHQVPSRLAQVIVSLESFGIIGTGKYGWHTVTHEELSKIVGTTRPNITNILKQFSEAGLIETKRGRLRVLSRERLARLRPTDGQYSSSKCSSSPFSSAAFIASTPSGSRWINMMISSFSSQPIKASPS